MFNYIHDIEIDKNKNKTYFFLHLTFEHKQKKNIFIFLLEKILKQVKDHNVFILNGYLNNYLK